MQRTSEEPHVAIIGGGIGGLSTAYHLQQQGNVAYTLIESASAWGGKITTEMKGGFVMESGPDSFITQKPAGVRLCRELGLEGRLLGTNDERRKVYVLDGGRLRALPEGVMLVIPTRFTPFVLSPLISLPGKARMGLDLFIPRRRENGDESLADFIRRRLGQEALDKIAEPLMAGIHVADAERLSLNSTFPRFVDLERKYRSLIKGIMIQKRRAPQPHDQRTSLFVTLRDGLQEMVTALVAHLAGELRLNSRVVRLDVVPDSTAQGSTVYRMQLESGQTVRANAVVLATPAYVAADLLEPTHQTLATKLRAIRHVSTATVSLGYRRAEFEHPLNGFGFVVPVRETTRLMACTWTSSKFSGRAPSDHVLVRAFIGGPYNEALVDLDDVALVQMVRDELRAIMGVSAKPVITSLRRWHRGNPQYDVGHLERVDEIDALASTLPGLHLTGSAYRGVGIPDCIEQGKTTAQAVQAAIAQHVARE